MVKVLRGHKHASRSLLILLSLFPQLIFFQAVHSQNTTLTVSTGTTLSLTGNHLVFYGTNLVSNGKVNAGKGIFWVNGAKSSSFGGTGSIALHTLNLNSAASDTLTLRCPLLVSDSLYFLNGLINLNGQELQLSNTGALYAESEASRITGITGGAVTASAPSAKNFTQLDLGNLGAVLTSKANLGTLSISRSHEPAVNPHDNSRHGIERTFLIQPQHDHDLHATLRFYYFDAELDGDNGNHLSLWKSPDGITWRHVGGDTRNPTLKYVEKKDVAELSYWTLSDHKDRLSKGFLLFSAICQSGEAQIQWQTELGMEAEHYEIERTTDGVNWVSVGEVPAFEEPDNSSAEVETGTTPPAGSTYFFTDAHPPSQGSYRIKMTDKTGELGFSPEFQIGCLDITLPFLVFPNPAREGTVAQLSVRESTTATIELFNMSGQIMYTSSWGLQPGINQFKLPLSRLAAGMYIVRVLVNGRIVESKLDKQ